jgi:hypothetical protein
MEGVYSAVRTGALDKAVCASSLKVWISEQTAIISLHSINLSVFITEAESVYCAVRSGSVCQAETVSPLKDYFLVFYELCERKSNPVTGPVWPRGWVEV